MLRLGIRVSCAILTQTCIGMGMFSGSLGARMVPASLTLFTFVMLILSLIFNLLHSSIALPVSVSMAFFVSSQFRLNLTCYASFKKIISMQVLSLKWYILCSSYAIAADRVIICIRNVLPTCALPSPSKPLRNVLYLCLYMHSCIQHVLHLMIYSYDLHQVIVGECQQVTCVFE